MSLLQAVILFFNHTPTTEIYTLSLHDALPISQRGSRRKLMDQAKRNAEEALERRLAETTTQGKRSEEHTSELQSRRDLVCRLLLEKKKEVSLDVHADACGAGGNAGRRCRGRRA